jgi:bile acid:Na+ symporter, BASS family
VSTVALSTVLAQAQVDDIQLDFDPSSLLLLNVILGLIMFGVALDVRLPELREVVRQPLAPAVGLLTQFLVLPAATFALTRVLDPAPSIALGMILVGCCPGGNVSNVITQLARGNTGLSIGMTGVSTLAAAVMTPLNFAFWGSRHPDTDAILRTVVVDGRELAVTIGLLLVLPVALGVTLRATRPALATRVHRPMRVVSLVFFAAFLAIAFSNNAEHLGVLLGGIAVAVALQNALALGSGYLAAAAVRLPEFDRRAVAIEVGIQNSALALVLIFGFFDGLGGMALVAAWWGIWHIISGLAIAGVWSRFPPARPADARVPVGDGA